MISYCVMTIVMYWKN